MPEKIICVVGPTACGKTKLGVLLAKRYDGEVVSADSMQIYKSMTIGTAAPTAEEMEGVPHHMIAVADPAEQWSAARYAQAAVPIVDDILRRGKRPILVGGTGLWLEAAVQGRTFAGGHAGGAVRKELQDRLAREGIGPLLEEHDAVLLANHGAVTLGADLENAYWRMETLEHTARICLNVRLLGGGVPLSPEQAAELEGG